MKGANLEDLYPCLLETALSGVQKEHPNFLDEVDPNPVHYDGTPSHLHPAFFGCFDWHSSVHFHWTIVRLLRLNPSLSLAKSALELLASHFTPENINQEIKTLIYLNKWEIPYGYSWFLALIANLHSWDKEETKEFLKALNPLEKELKGILTKYFETLKAPDREGQHNNTAFSLILLYNYGMTTGNKEFTELIKETAMKFFYNDASFDDEVTLYDFLSPSLCVLHLLSIILTKEEFIKWASKKEWQSVLKLTPAKGNLKDPYEAHLVGLNFSRCWSLNRLAIFFPKEEAALKKLAKEHFDFTLPFLSCGEWNVEHWVATYTLMASLSFNQINL